ncbi:hypothetical protein ALI144C_41720 [Actinosynnema sp. ALI-1.44]|uniref:YqcI/YcgG family protein n=1 Tax=Actinosynnema sp. ALI-1.44 TaxID=1933779 RepID=UPI00097C83A6|nr:YqcI/YcgG family protein [Actinosynnema sp. ALI-1.44]ONI75253.1 hypothetical protein ALI144C_41720 [Actinosynnema sp. ALI-1.44]
MIEPVAARLPVAQIQAAVSRTAMRADHSVAPLSAVFYLQERHALLETAVEEDNRTVIESALVDLYAASAWIADGYGVVLKKAYQGLGHSASLDKVIEERRGHVRGGCEMATPRALLTEVVRNIGLYEIGYDTVNAQSLRPLHQLIPEYHIALLDIAITLDLQVFDRLRSAFTSEPVGQLAATFHNPMYAQSARRFEPVVNHTYCPFATVARLWGAPDHDSSLTVADNVRAALDGVLRFTRAAQREVLDGFVFAFPSDQFGGTLARLGRLLRTVLGTLMASDPREPRVLNRGDVVREGWRFSFDGEDYFVPVFAPLYGQDHSRYTYGVDDTVFILLQPDSSFHARLGRDSGQIRKQIRQRFSDGLQSYSGTGELEAHRFLPALGDGTPAPAWYDAAIL